MQFKDIIGHKDIKEHLVRTVLENRVSHAQLFLGPEGSGSLALAYAYAQFLNCENKQPTDSCGTCPACRKYSKLIHPDLHMSYPFIAKHKEDTATDYAENWRKAFMNNPYMGLEYWRNQLDADNKQVNINIAEAHGIIKKLSLKAFEAEYKVLIMWLPEYLDTQGNALLKLIEEPPEKTLFILVAENPDKILNTIISRTQLVKIKKLEHMEVVQHLKATQQLTEQEASEIAFIADGNMQVALNQLQTQGNNHFGTLVNWLRFIVSDAGTNMISLVEDDLSKMGRENQKCFLFYAINMMRQIILIKGGLSSLVFLSTKELDFVQKFSAHYNIEQIEATINLLEETHYFVERNANPKILFLDLSLQLTLIYKYKTIPKGTQYI